MLDACVSMIAWVTSVKYLGIILMAANPSFNSSCVKQSFFAACNSIYAHAKDLDEVMHLTLQECYCLPILTYAAVAVKYTVRQEDELNAACNSVYRRIFGFNKWESVRAFINGLGRLDLHHIFMLRRLNFYIRLCNTDVTLLCNVLWTSIRQNCSDWILQLLVKYLTIISYFFIFLVVLCVYYYGFVCPPSRLGFLIIVLTLCRNKVVITTLCMQ